MFLKPPRILALFPHEAALFMPPLLFVALLTGCNSGSSGMDNVESAVNSSRQATTNSESAVGASDPMAGSPAPTNSDQVVIDNFAFTPAVLTVSAGTKVTWLNRDDVPHTATSTSKPRVFDSKTLDTDEKFSYVFGTRGTYEYFCAVHPHMTGKIIVK
jgi:plastocyanin